VSTVALTAPSPAPTVLGDVLPGARARDALLVLAGAGLTTLGAQVSIAIPGSPVPVTGQTLGVVLAGAALGARRGAASQLLYLLLGLLLPVYADGASGAHVVWGATGGYLVGFVLAAGLIGFAAQRGADRVPLVAAAVFVAGQLAIFAVGVPWLKVSTDMPWGDAVHYGFTVFIAGGVVKAVLAAGLTPGAWRLARRVEG
jgi:biotin transport system substrate-specific component